MIQAVIFDMDGVIIDSQKKHDEMWVEFFEKHGAKLAEGDIQKTHGVPAEAGVRAVMPNVSEDELADLARERIELLEAHMNEPFPLVPGVSAFMVELKKRNIPIAVGTSTVRHIAEKLLKNSGVWEYVDTLVAADEVKNGKPNPETFLRAAEKLEVTPENCIVFEDEFVGVEAAQKGGMQVAAITTSHPAEEFSSSIKTYVNFTQVSVEELLR